MMNGSEWTQGQRDLWARIAAHDFEPAGHALTFMARLARDHGWSLAVARRAVEEYRRFCFLAVTSPTPMTPSEDADEVWHLHLTFSRDYWEVWCREVLGVALHHQPTIGGAVEGRRFSEQYAHTLARYEMFFGAPDADLWPGVAARFATRPRFRTIDRDRAIVIPLPATLGRRARRFAGATGLAALVSLISAGPASALPLNVLDWTAGPFLTLYVVMAAGVLTLAYGLSVSWGGPDADGPPIDNLGPIALAFLAGGERRAAEAMALSFVQSGDLSMGKNGTLVIAARHGPVPPAHLVRFADGDLKGKHLPGALRPRLDRVRERLVALGLVLSREDEARRRLVTAGIVAPVLALGGAKMMVGLGRDKPVGFLMLLLLGTLVAGAAIAFTGRIATPAGRRAIADFADWNARAVRAPLPDEVIIAFAIVGTAALLGTDLAPYARVLASKSDGSSGGDGGCGGGGGGGCGGCGGE